MTGRLDGKIAIVTGAGCIGPGWGNGRATAVRFAEEGALVLAVDRDAGSLAETVALTEGSAGKIVPHIADVTHSDDVAAVAASAVARWRRIDVLVNNVGGSAPGGPVELAEDVWDAQVAYAATKAGVIQLGRVVAVQYAAQHIRVNTVVPGQLHSPMVEARPAGQRADGDVDALLRQRQDRIPLGFMGDGRDTANAALYLASDEARFVTGSEIVVDGGMTARCD